MPASVPPVDLEELVQVAAGSSGCREKLNFFYDMVSFVMKLPPNVFKTIITVTKNRPIFQYMNIHCVIIYPFTPVSTFRDS